MQYSEERKASVLKKMIPPHTQSLSQLAAQAGQERLIFCSLCLSKKHLK